MEDKVFRLLYGIEKEHWWHRGRHAIIKKIMEGYLPTGTKPRILEVGCGTGVNYELLSQFGNVTGVEVSKEAIRLCRERGFLDVVEGDIAQCPPTLLQHRYDHAVMLDVLEHIEDDDAVLQNLGSVIKPGGYLFISVPAFEWLWSPFDEFSHHWRRYSAQRLREKLEKHNFEIKTLTYFNTFLFPLIFLMRKIESVFHIYSSEKNLLLPPKALNFVLYTIFRSEKYFFPRFRFPFGVSIFFVVKNCNPDANLQG